MIHTMKQLIKRILPIRILHFYYSFREMKNIFVNFIYDMKRYLRYSASLNSHKTNTRLQGRLIHAYHNIEKGLSLKNPRIGFGKEKVKYLISLIENYKNRFGWDETSRVALNVLFSYYKFNKENGLDDQQLYSTLMKLKMSIPNHLIDIKEGGAILVKKEDIINSSQVDFNNFVKSRYSIRNFAEGNIDMDIIEKAVMMAQKTPSVCNRQTSKVYVFSDEQSKKEILKYQNGNRGFGDTADKILLVTSNLEYFNGVAERYQAYIDGGMFAMSLVYALHSLGVGTCCLNLSIPKEIDLRLKEVAGIPFEESVIMMIAVGEIPNELYVAQSHRKPLDEVLIKKKIDKTSI